MLNKNYFLVGIVLSLVYEILYFVCLLNIYKNIIVTLLLCLLLLSVIPFFCYIFERSGFNKKLRLGALFGTLPAAAILIIITVYSPKALKDFDIYLLPSVLGVITVSVLAIYLEKSQVNLRTPIMLSAAYSFLITVPFYICSHIAAITKNVVLSGIGFIVLIIATVGCYLVFRYIAYQRYAETVFYFSLWSFIISYGIPSCVLLLWLSSIKFDSMMWLYIIYYPPILLFILIIDSIVLLTQKKS